MAKPRALNPEQEGALLVDYMKYLSLHPKRLARKYGISVRTVRDYYNRWLREQARQRSRGQTRVRSG